MECVPGGFPTHLDRFGMVNTSCAIGNRAAGQCVQVFSPSYVQRPFSGFVSDQRSTKAAERGDLARGVFVFVV